MEITFRFQPDPAEQARASQAVTKGSRAALFWTLAPIGVAVSPLVLFLWLGPSTWRRIQVPVWSLVALFLLYVVTAPTILRLRLRRAHRQEPLLFSEQVLTLSPAGLRVQSAGGETSFKWQAISRVRETAEFYLFHYTRHCAFYLPKRVIVTDDEDQQLRDLVRAHAPDRGRELARKLASSAPAT